MASYEFEKLIEQAAVDGKIPGAVLLATNGDSSFTYSKSIGRASLRPEDQRPLGQDSVLWIASCTKLMTSLCALQLVSRNLLSLDSPTLVYTHIPELASYPVLHGFTPSNTPITTPHKTPITLRHLLTHTSGLTYDVLHPLATQWCTQNNKPLTRGGTVLTRHDHPLVFEPGTSWIYGPGLDFAGLLIERVTAMSLEEYMKTHLWTPLAIKNMTFHLSTRPDMRAKQADMAYRDAETGLLAYQDARLHYQDPEGREVEACLGGEGAFASPEEYLKVLRGVLAAGAAAAAAPGEQPQDPSAAALALSPAMWDEFFTPQLDAAAAGALNAMVQVDFVNDAMGGTNKAVSKNWGLGGMLLDGDDHPGGRKAGTMIWGGLPMLTWFVDRKTGLCGLFSTQVMPTGDAVAAALTREFENGVYEMYGKWTGASASL